MSKDIMKARLLIFHPAIAPYRIDFFNELSRAFDTTVCLSLKTMTSQHFDDEYIARQLCFRPIINEKSNGYFTWVLKQIRMIVSTKPHIVIVSEFGITTLLAILIKIIFFKKYKIVSIVDDSFNMVAGNNQFTKIHKYATLCLMPFLDDVINVEPKVVEYFQNKYGKGILFPIITDDIKANARLARLIPNSNRLIDEYRLEGKRILLYVGRMVKLKNIKFAVECFIEAKIDNSIFVIIGSGPEYDSLYEWIKSFDNILLLGRLEGDQLYAWYNIAQILTLQSFQEPFGAVTNEALQGGCKVLVSRLAGSNCLVKEGYNGYLINPYKKEDYINKLILLMKQCHPVSYMLVPRNSMMVFFFIEYMNNVKDKLLKYAGA